MTNPEDIKLRARAIAEQIVPDGLSNVHALTLSYREIAEKAAMLAFASLSPERDGEMRERVEHLARLLFVWDEREGGNAMLSVVSDSVRYWFAQGPDASGEDAHCYQVCQDLRRQAAFLLSHTEGKGS